MGVRFTKLTGITVQNRQPCNNIVRVFDQKFCTRFVKIDI
jgi:hypothetical protein